MSDGRIGDGVSRRGFAALGAAAVATALTACTAAEAGPVAASSTPSAPVPGEYVPVRINGGGWVTGFAQSGSRTYARTDVGGAYVLRPGGAWQQLLTVDSVRSGIGPDDSRVDAVACAAENPDRVVVLVAPTADGDRGNLLRSRDGGRTWTRLPQTWPVAEAADGAGGSRIAFDPADDDVVLLAAGGGRLAASQDFGATWRQVSSPAGGSAISAVLITRGAQQSAATWWVASVGSGVWRSDDDGASWARALPLAAAGDRVGDLQQVAGALLVCVESTAGSGGLWRVPAAGGSPVEIGPAARVSVRSIAVDPQDPDSALLVPSYLDASQSFFTCGDLSGARPSWVARSWSIGPGGSSTWPRRVTFETLSSGQARYASGRLLYAEGMGVWEVRVQAAAVLVPSSGGIQELVGNRVLKPADGPLLTASWDRGVLAVADPGASTRAQVAPTLRRGFGSAWDLTASPTNPAFIAAIADDHQDPTGRTVPDRRASGYSTDSGRTWTRFPALQRGAPADLLFGNIAVSAGQARNLVWLPSNLSGTASAVYFTTDRGSTWSRGRLTGITDDDVLHPTFTLARKVLVAGPERPGSFVILGSTRAGTPVVWQSEDGGATWSRSTPAGLQQVRDAQYGTQVVRLGSGFVAVTGASDGPVLLGSGVESWSVDDSVQGGVALTTGPTETGAQQAVYLYAGAGKSAGLHVSVDGGRDWRKVGGPVLRLGAPVRSITADPSVPGRVYLATGGNGFARLDVHLPDAA